ncbi:hypothetical protein ABW19_dt0202495 [Dactylella cylindrospora]|nr:hypothetical protein ABW19_dt0202495 [Dactylella cylindrospora]
MSPSRGHSIFKFRFAPVVQRCLHTTRPRANHPEPPQQPPPSKTPLELLRVSPHRLHIYRSNSTNPYFNLSAEDYLLRHSPYESTILFTYVNAPSIVIGRNQNPWNEINFPLLRTPEYSHVNYVRRRSGGGTVYHDLGNLCWSVIMPRKEFDRDKNAHLVVRALKKLGVENAAVNERHDIVLREKEGDKKVSGSAYKIIKDRSYHHATLLLRSDLESIGRLLRSPLRGYLQTKGVESVRSPVVNIGVGKDQLVEAIEEEFRLEYSSKDEFIHRVELEEEESIRVRDYIREGMEELQGKFALLATSAKIIHSSISTASDPDFAFVQSQESHNRLLDKHFSGPELETTIKEIVSLNGDVAKDFAEWLGVAVGEWVGEEERVREEGEVTMRERSVRRMISRGEFKRRLEGGKEGEKEGSRREEKKKKEGGLQGSG